MQWKELEKITEDRNDLIPIYVLVMCLFNYVFINSFIFWDWVLISSPD
jgi:hypothetical protein